MRQPASATLLFPSIFWTIRILENSKWVPLVDGGYITLLNKLNESLGGSLRLFKGDPCVILPKLIEDYSVSNVFWNRCYEPWRIDRDKKIKNELETNNIIVESFCGSLLWEPWNISKDDGTPYRVFTPYYKKKDA